MAECVVPPNAVIVKCKSCKALYVPDRIKDRKWHDHSFASFEKCPVCGYDENNYRCTIPLWKYNLIRIWREHTSYERIDNSGSAD